MSHLFLIIKDRFGKVITINMNDKHAVLRLLEADL